VDAELLDRLIGLERAMWASATRRDRRWMDEHLSSTFTEFGRSGASYDRDVICDQHYDDIDVALVDLAVRPLGEECALVTYRSIEQRGHTHRASIWRRATTDVGWQLEFHQGTPTEP